jgi:hypothetical protein
VNSCWLSSSSRDEGGDGRDVSLASLRPLEGAMGDSVLDGTRRSMAALLVLSAVGEAFLIVGNFYLQRLIVFNVVNTIRKGGCWISVGANSVSLYPSTD